MRRPTLTPRRKLAAFAGVVVIAALPNAAPAATIDEAVRPVCGGTKCYVGGA